MKTHSNMENKYYKNFENIYETYKNKIRAYIYYKLGKINDEDDLLQDIFIKVYECIDEYDENSGSFYCFIILKAKQVICDYARKNKRRHDKFEEHITDFIKLENDNPYEISESKETTNIVSGILNKLSDDYRKAILLIYRDELSYKESAKIMNKSLPAFKSLLRRAKVELKKRILEEYPDITDKYRHPIKIVLILCISVGLISGLVYATIKIYKNVFKPSTFTLSDIKEEVPEGNGIISREDAVNKINAYLSILGKDANVKNDDLKLVRDFQIYKICWTVTYENDFSIKIDAENGNISKYYSYNDETYVLRDDNIKEVYDSLKLPSEYTLLKDEENDGIRNIEYAKKYGEIYNKYQSVRFVIDNNKLMTICNYDISYQDEKIEISKEEAKNIFKKNNISYNKIYLDIELIQIENKSNQYEKDEEITNENFENIQIYKIYATCRKVWRTDLDGVYMIDTLNGDIIINELNNKEENS